MGRKMNWEGAARREATRRDPEPRLPRAATRRQRRYIHALRRERQLEGLGRDPMAMTMLEASEEIERLKAIPRRPAA